MRDESGRCIVCLTEILNHTNGALLFAGVIGVLSVYLTVDNLGTSRRKPATRRYT